MFIRRGCAVFQGSLRVSLNQQGEDEGEGEVAVLAQASSGIAEVAKC